MTTTNEFTNQCSCQNAPSEMCEITSHQYTAFAIRFMKEHPNRKLTLEQAEDIVRFGTCEDDNCDCMWSRFRRNGSARINGSSRVNVSFK